MITDWGRDSSVPPALCRFVTSIMQYAYWWSAVMWCIERCGMALRCVSKRTKRHAYDDLLVCAIHNWHPKWGCNYSPSLPLEEIALLRWRWQVEGIGEYLWEWGESDAVRCGWVVWVKGGVLRESEWIESLFVQQTQVNSLMHKYSGLTDSSPHLNHCIQQTTSLQHTA